MTPKRNAAFEFYCSLVSQANAQVFITNPTLAAGDVLISKDGGAEANLTTLPVVTPAGSKAIKVSLSATEMDADNVRLTFSDVAGAEWADLTLDIQTTANQIDDLALDADVETLLTRLTSARAGYLENLNVGGLVASSAEATAIQNNTRVVRVVPATIERPDADGPTSGTTPDSSVYNRRATLVGTTLPVLVASHAAAFGNAFEFDGIDLDANSCGITTETISSVGLTALTMEGWFRRDRQGVIEVILFWGTDENNYVGEIIFFSDGKCYCNVKNSGGTVFTIASDATVANGWHHVRAVWTGTTIRLFLDGALQSGSAAVANLRSGSFAIGIGRQAGVIAGASPYSFQGAADEVRISTIARSTSTFTPDVEPYEDDASTLRLYHLDAISTFQEYRIELLLYDAVGNMEVPDAAPTIELVNQNGIDRSFRLDSTTMALVSTGRYRAIYTASPGDVSPEQLVWMFSVVEGGQTRLYGNDSIVVDTTAVDFTAADRVKLDTLHDTRLTAGRAANLDNLDVTVSSRLAAADYVLPPTAAAIWTIDFGNGRTPKQALQFLRNKKTIEQTSATAGVLHVFAEDDLTEVWQAALTLDSAQVPVSGVDP